MANKNITRFKKVQAKDDLFLGDQKCITKGKVYEVIRGGWRNLFIIDDTGDEIKLYHDNVTFKYLVS
jgi:hypothetical protein